jgi:DNA-binding response OmpR family regulator
MNEKVLIVDDRPDTINLINYALNSLGYVTFSAADGKKALALMKKHPIDLVILDVMMPGMSGKDVLKKIRANKNYNKTKVIMLTAVRYNKDEQKDFIKLGAQGFLTKPISIASLEENVKKALKAKVKNAN